MIYVAVDGAFSVFAQVSERTVGVGEGGCVVGSVIGNLIFGIGTSHHALVVNIDLILLAASGGFFSFGCRDAWRD